MTMKRSQLMDAILVLLVIFDATNADLYSKPIPQKRMRHRIYERDSLNKEKFNEDRNCTHPVSFDSRVGFDNRQLRGYDGQIVYPDSVSVPKSKCMHGLCTEVDNYPKQRIADLLSKSQFSSYFESVALNNRFKPEEPNDDEDSYCETMQHSVYPEKARNLNNDEKIIVNVDGHKQGIVFETCAADKPCKFNDMLPTGYTSFCKQKFVIRRLMVFSEDEKFAFDSFEIPSCCLCILRKSGVNSP